MSYVSMTGCGTTAWVPPPGDVRICNGKMFEALNDGGTVVSLNTYPKQPFDFAGRTGKVVFDVSADSQGSHGAWPEFVITDKPVPGMRSGVSGGTPPGAQNEVGITFDGCSTTGSTTGVGLVYVMRNGVVQRTARQRCGLRDEGFVDVVEPLRDSHLARTVSRCGARIRARRR